jgi:hypothetical protein
MVKRICAILLLVLMAATAIGCGDPQPEETPYDQPIVSEEENADPAQSEDGEADSPSGINEALDTAVSDTVISQIKSDKDKVKGTLKCTLSINCSTVFDNLNKIDAAIVDTLPKDGWIYPAKEVEFTEGESVFDILQRVVKEEKIHMESNSNPALKSKYVEGIHNLYEFDAGELSGWTYKVNGKGMGYGSSSSFPKDGDIVEWIYTCDQGRDAGVIP